MNAYQIVESCLDGKGLSDKKGVTEADVDQEQLRMGIEIEKEHTDDLEIAKKIALDHLSENPTYYSYLKNMEDQFNAATKRP